MTMHKDLNLFDKSESIDFYNDRYSQGYMEDWPLKKKQRIIQIIKSLNLPERGEALDYGCGNGVFTAVIKEVLPNWNVSGSDVSEVAIKNAAKRYPDCQFFYSENKEFINKKFDFIFSHHVLEHVYDIDKSCEEIASLTSPHAYLLHVLPCGNKGSLEYTICSSREGGINKEIQNRFFYEDPGHVRRLKSQELSDKFKIYRFNLVDGYFSNQYYGAFDWITDYDTDFINEICDIKKTKGFLNKVNLIGLRIRLLLLYKTKSIVKFYNNSSNAAGVFNKVKFFVAQKVSDFYLKKSEWEWEHHSKQQNGSEMYICFKKS